MDSRILNIALGYKIKDGPWGGGNQFLKSFRDYFQSRGAKVGFELEKGLDLILIINPRKESSAFGLEDVKRYKRSFPKAKVITRINDSDKTGKSYKADCLRLEACKISDGVVFISNWLLDYYLERGFNKDTPHTVINNGPDENIFNPQGYIPWRKGEVMRIVTHHWSDNCMKGADVYKRFDEILDEPSIRKDFSFTYIGHLPSYPYKIQFKNTKYLVPLALETLASELKSHHVYLTAARWEGCGMHQLEGACCGLPVLFSNEGGGAVECCQGFGIQFTEETFREGLFKMLNDYAGLQPKMKEFPLNASLMNKRYEEFISRILLT